MDQQPPATAPAPRLFTPEELKASADAEIARQLEQMKRGDDPPFVAPSPAFAPGPAFPPPAPAPIARPAGAVPPAASSTQASTAQPAQSPSIEDAAAAEWEALALARFLEFAGNDGRPLFIDPSSVALVEGHATDAVCKLHGVGFNVTVHGKSRDVGFRISQAAQARRDLERHLERERAGMLVEAVREAREREERERRGLDNENRADAMRDPPR